MGGVVAATLLVLAALLWCVWTFSRAAFAFCGRGGRPAEGLDGGPIAILLGARFLLDQVVDEPQGVADVVRLPDDPPSFVPVEDLGLYEDPCTSLLAQLLDVCSPRPDQLARDQGRQSDVEHELAGLLAEQRRLGVALAAGDLHEVRHDAVQGAEDLLRVVAVQHEDPEGRRGEDLVTLADPHAAPRLLLNCLACAPLAPDDVGSQGISAEHLESELSHRAKASSVGRVLAPGFAV
mmetsp:Transcript_75124/g.220162  ORF Transcript_75124/g.220162 Transcript_75124/m.220162 type:complete len:236 (+) Transcript_75124:543-1250(+)